MSQKRKRCSLSVAEKRNIISYVDKNPMMKKLDIACKFGIPASTLATILKFKDKFSEENGLPVNYRRLKPCEFKDVEECVIKWLKQCRDKKITIRGNILQAKAQQFAVELGHDKFRASNGWLQNFKKRNEIAFRRKCSESGGVDENVCDLWNDKLAELAAGYDPEDIFNAGEPTFDDNLSVCGQLTDTDIVTSVLPVTHAEADEDEEEVSKIDERNFTVKDAYNALSILKSVFLKKEGLSDDVVKSITKLDCALDMMTVTCGEQTNINDLNQNEQNGN